MFLLSLLLMHKTRNSHLVIVKMSVCLLSSGMVLGKRAEPADVGLALTELGFLSWPWPSVQHTMP